MRTPSGPTSNSRRNLLLVFLALLTLSLGVLYHEAFQPNYIMWANDGPLGALKADSARLPGTFFGRWANANWVGQASPSAAPTLTTAFLMMVTPEIFMKVYAPLTLLLVGLCAWIFFRELGFSQPVCVLASLAAGLNMHFFSVACWGLGTWNVCFAMIFLALAALVTKSIRQLWLKGALTGLAIGMAVMEGFDSGAILSFYTALFVVFLCWIADERPAKGFFKGVAMAVLIAIFALFISISKLSTLVETQVSGSARNVEAIVDKDSNWDFATKWSIPKLEALRVIIPGIFGYRMREDNTEADKSNSYWGHVAEDHRLEDLESENPQVRVAAAKKINAAPDLVASIESSDPDVRDTALQAILTKHPLQRRHSGNGEYASVLISLLAILAISSSLRRGNSPYSVIERKIIWFWAVAALFSMVASWGKHAFLYTLLYHYVPYFSAMRNPLKFMHPFQIAWLILGAFGLEALHRRYFQPAASRSESILAHLANWWKKAQGFEKKWAAALGLVVVAAAAGWMAYNSEQPKVARYLLYHGFNNPATMPAKIAQFSVNEAGLFVICLAISAGALVCALSGAWAGPRAKWGWIILGAILIVDLGHADRPWVWYYDYTEKYQTNDLLDFLKTSPSQYRVTAKLGPNDGSYSLSGHKNFAALCHWWLENDFAADNIQSLDIDQWPRMPLLDTNFLSNFYVHTNTNWKPAARLWQLTNTRYVLAAAGMEPMLNERASSSGHDFRIHALYGMPKKIDPKTGTYLPRLEDAGDLTVVPDKRGSFALIEYTNVLPRAKLYADWQVSDDSETLKTLASAEFDPNQHVLISKDSPAPPSPVSANADPGAVNIAEYKPRYIKLQAEALAPSVLLLNDRDNPEWKAWVDDKPTPIMRCNYLMRGIFLTPGQHLIEFRFQPAIRLLYVSLLAVAFGIGLLVWLFYNRTPAVTRVEATSVPAPEPAQAKTIPTPQKPPQKAQAKVPAKAAAKSSRRG